MLSDFLQFGSGVFRDWEQDKVFKENRKLLESAERKVKNVADNLR